MIVFAGKTCTLLFVQPADQVRLSRCLCIASGLGRRKVAGKSRVGLDGKPQREEQPEQNMERPTHRWAPTGELQSNLELEFIGSKNNIEHSATTVVVVVVVVYMMSAILTSLRLLFLSLSLLLSIAAVSLTGRQK